MKTKGSLLFAEGPPTGFAISFFLGLLRRIQTPNWAFKVGVLCNEYDRVCVLPEEALREGAGGITRREQGEAGGDLSRCGLHGLGARAALGAQLGGGAAG